MTCDTSLRVPGMRVIKPSLARVAAVSSVYSLASATRYRGRRGTRKGRHQGLSPLLENLCIRRIAIPTFAHQGHAAILGHQQF